MTRRRPWDNEAHGAALIAELLGGRATPRDVAGAAPGTHDFDIEIDSGDTIALEVTQHAHGGILAQRSLEAKLDWAFPALTHDWVVDVREPCDIKALHREIADVLAHFETTGRDRWLRGRDPLDIEANERLKRLRVQLVYRLADATSGTVTVGSAPAGGSTSPDLLIGVVEDHARREDNVAKLRRATYAAERHLLVWIHADFHQLTAAMSMGFLPAALPNLPNGITAVWVASGYENPTVWRVDAVCWSNWTRRD